MGSKKDKQQMRGAEPVAVIHDEMARLAVPRHMHRGLDQEVHYLRTTVGRLSRQVQELTEARAHHEHGPDGAPVRYGMHMDSEGNYFLRKPDGWHRVVVMRPSAGPVGRVQRLAESRD